MGILRMLLSLAAAARAMGFHVHIADTPGAATAPVPQHYWPTATGPIPPQYSQVIESRKRPFHRRRNKTRPDAPNPFRPRRYWRNGTPPPPDPSDPANRDTNWTWPAILSRWADPRNDPRMDIVGESIFLAGGPVIDSAREIYQGASDGVHKFSPDGQQLWHYQSPADMNSGVALLGEAVLSSDLEGHAWALDRTTGALLWKRQVAKDAGLDVTYPSAYNGIFVMAAENSWGRPDRRGPDGGGNARIFGLDAATGELLWDFKPDFPLYFFTPLLPGDRSLVFMDFTGGVYRLELRTGKLIWHQPGSAESFSEGGPGLGPNKAVYTCSNPGADRGTEGTQGILRAFALTDGRVLWERILPKPCNSYPVVGYRRPDFNAVSRAAPLSVIVSTGGTFQAETRGNLTASVMMFSADDGALQLELPLQNTKAEAHHFAWGELYAYFMAHALTVPAHPYCRPPPFSVPFWSSDRADLEDSFRLWRSDHTSTDIHFKGPADFLFNDHPAKDEDAEMSLTHNARDHGFDGFGKRVNVGPWMPRSTAVAPGLLVLSSCRLLHVLHDTHDPL